MKRGILYSPQPQEKKYGSLFFTVDMSFFSPNSFGIKIFLGLNS